MALTGATFAGKDEGKKTISLFKKFTLGIAVVMGLTIAPGNASAESAAAQATYCPYNSPGPHSVQAD